MSRAWVTPYVMVTAPDGPYKTVKSWWRRQRPIPAISRLRRRALAAPRISRPSTSSTLRHQDVACAVPGLAGSHPGHYCGAHGFLHGADQYGGWAGERAAPHGTWPLHAPACRCDAQCCAAGRAGVADYDVSLWFGMWAPAGTPPSIVQKLNSGVASALQNPDVVEQFGKLGIGPLPMNRRNSQASCAARLRSTSASSSRPAYRSSKAHAPPCQSAFATQISHSPSSVRMVRAGKMLNQPVWCA